MSSNERKWEANREKVAYARQFPGMVSDLKETVGKTVAEVRESVGAPGLTAIIFTDLTFHLTHNGREPVPADLLRALEELRPLLASGHGDAYRRLDELSRVDRELSRRARLENILGAIRTNIGAMPELGERVRALLDELDAGGGSCGTVPGGGDAVGGADDAG